LRELSKPQTYKNQHEWANLTTGIFTISGKNDTFHEAPGHRETQAIVDQQA